MKNNPFSELKLLYINGWELGESGKSFGWIRRPNCRENKCNVVDKKGTILGGLFGVGGLLLQR